MRLVFRTTEGHTQVQVAAQDLRALLVRLLQEVDAAFDRDLALFFVGKTLQFRLL